MSRNKGKIDLSSGDLEGSHTIALRGGEEVGYQGRKKRKTTNALYFTDRQGLPQRGSKTINKIEILTEKFENVVSRRFVRRTS
nr:hypothetical protein [Elizabethkingia sp. ASV34]